MNVLLIDVLVKNNIDEMKLKMVLYVNVGVTNIESVASARRHDGVLCHLHISSRAFSLVTFPYIRESDHAWADIDKEGTVTQ